MLVEKKNIKILSRGPIKSLSGVFGPIITPYMEKVQKITGMLMENHTVVEVLPDGTEIPLTLINHNTDNTPVTKKVYEAPVILAQSKQIPEDMAPKNEEVKVEPPKQTFNKNINVNNNKFIPKSQLPPLVEKNDETVPPTEVKPDVNL